ncbi:single-stranded DNA-binding protein [Oligella urethralis]|uniref:Single-stranded DNA-binding protein n=1 Tax=Oligella urethralis TaxID=90245 RepID=A0A2X1VKY0_9BURK|nr:single-stranded DNA-binding protein [Oligella urethralis]SPY09100.1 Helix-destabilizing protein [Oligella urethralis]
MSAYINEATIMGNLGRKPELKYFADGTPSLRLSIATTFFWIDKQTGEKNQVTQWHMALLKGRQAENIANFMDKGDKIWVRGQLKHRDWVEADGTARQITEIDVRESKIINTRKRHDTSSASGDDMDVHDSFDMADMSDPLDGFSG